MNRINETIVTNQQGNPDAGLRTSVAARPQPCRSLQECMDTLPGHAWRDAAERLAQWTDDRLVNRSDVYRAYKLPNNRYLGEPITYTKPFLEEARDFGSQTRSIVEGHYRCGDPIELIGLHAISFDNTARWFVINVDQKDANGAILAEANANAAFGWYEDLKLLGFRPLLLDANEAGGYHLLVCLSEAIPSRRVHEFATDFVQNYADYGLAQAPEVYPSEPDLDPHRPYGSWWRLPGRHHTREFWTRVWDGERWLEDQEAIEAILSIEGDSPELIPGFQDS